MNCTVKPLQDVTEDEIAALLLLSNENSDFQKKLDDYAPWDLPGYISIVRRDGAIVGWARTEPWETRPSGFWDTLEAFVRPDERGKGIAIFAAAGLRASEAVDLTTVAVFDPKMLMVARSAGFIPQLFKRQEDGAWIRA